MPKKHMGHGSSSPREDIITEKEEMRTQVWWKRYLPTDAKSTLTALVILTCLIVGIIAFVKTGNTSLLLAILKSITGLP